jgi:TatD DNase family protein
MSVAGLVDTHAHLDDRRLAAQLPAVLDRARSAGLIQVVAIATSASSSAATQAIAAGHRGVFASVGMQPNDLVEAQPGDWERVVALSSLPRVVALGETGLDRYWDRTPFDVQQDYFDRHLALGRERSLPVVIHCRNCERDVAEQIERFGPPVRGVLHSFTGSWEDAQAFLAVGLHISFAGMVTFQNRALDSLREVALQVPLDRLLVETDSPYLSPHPFRGQSNEPSRLAVTAERLAQLRGLSLAEFAHLTTANARALFSLPVDDAL